MGGIEDAVLEDMVELEVGTYLRLVEGVLGLAHLLGVEGPVPGLELERLLSGGFRLLIDDLLHLGRLLACVGLRGGGARGLVLQDVGGVVGIPEQCGPLRPELHHLRRHGGVVVGAAVGPPDGGLEDALPQRPVLELRQHRLAGCVLHRDDPLALQLPALGRLRGGPDLLVGKAVQVGNLVHHHGGGVGGLEQVLLEMGGEGGNLLVHLSKLGLVRVRERRARAHELGVVALQQAQRLGIEAQGRALVVQRLHAREQRRIQEDRVLVRGELGRHLRVGVGRGQVEEHHRDAAEQLTRALQGDDGVVESRGLGVVRDGVRLLLLLRHAGLEGRPEIGVPDPVERWKVVRQRALRRERVVLRERCGRRCGRQLGGVGGQPEQQAAGRQRQCPGLHVSLPLDEDDDSNSSGPVAGSR